MHSKSAKSTPPEGKPCRRFWLAGFAVAGLAGVAVFAQVKLPEAGNTKTAETTIVASTRVVTRDLQKTIRLTGVTTAEKYADLVAPQLRGGRHGGGGGGGSISTGAGRGSSRSSSSGASSSSGGSSSGSGSSSSAGGQAGSSFRGTTSRFGSTGTSSAQSSSGSSASSSSGGSSSGGSSGSSSSGSSGSRSSGSGSAVQGISMGGGGRGGGGGRSFGSSLLLKELAKSGSSVKKGDTIAEFDREDMLTRLGDFEAQVLIAETTMKSIDAQLAVIQGAHQQTIQAAKADMEKAKLDLKTLPVRSAITTELFRLAAEESEARYKQLLSEVKLMETSLSAQKRIADLEFRETKAEQKRLQMNIDKMVIRSPLDGIVVMKTTFRGGEQAQIEKGDQLWSGQPFMQVVDTSSMLVSASVNQVDAEVIRLGAKARIGFDAYPDLELPATVYGIGAMPRAGGWRANYVKEIPVVLRLDRTEPRVIPDLSVSVDILLEEEKSALVVPLESVFRDGPASQPFVFLRQPAGWERREVELGLSNYSAVAVRSGLSAGDVIAREWPAIGLKK